LEEKDWDKPDFAGADSLVGNDIHCQNFCVAW
jgi:hypothetical protein